jgi:hypothetical protein
VTTSLPEQEPLIRRVLGDNYLELKLLRLVVDERVDAATTVKLTVVERDLNIEVEGKGVGAVDAIYAALLDRYGREYQSLKTLKLVNFHVTADLETKTRSAGADSVAKVTLDVANSDGRRFPFGHASRSMMLSSGCAMVAMVQYFVNAERAFLTLHNARRDAASRGREDLVARYTAEMAEVVESTSYAEVIANIRKEIS